MKLNKTPLKSTWVYSKHEWPISPLKLHSIKEKWPTKWICCYNENNLSGDLSGLKKLSVLSWVEIWMAFIQSALRVIVRKLEWDTNELLTDDRQVQTELIATVYMHVKLANTVLKCTEWQWQVQWMLVRVVMNLHLLKHCCTRHPQINWMRTFLTCWCVARLLYPSLILIRSSVHCVDVIVDTLSAADNQTCMDLALRNKLIDWWLWWFCIIVKIQLRSARLSFHATESMLLSVPCRLRPQEGFIIQDMLWNSSLCSGMVHVVTVVHCLSA